MSFNDRSSDNNKLIIIYFHDVTEFAANKILINNSKF